MALDNGQISAYSYSAMRKTVHWDSRLLRTPVTLVPIMRLFGGPVLCALAAPLAAFVLESGAQRGALAVIADAFSTHAVVAVGEAHGNVRDHEFRLALIRDPRLFARVDDVVVEFGNARYQQLVDRFVAGKRVPDAELRRVWQDTTAPHSVWDRPIYDAFFRAVRELNAGPRRMRPLRVLLGDPPIDWTAVHSAADLRRWQAMRVTHAASVVKNEVLDKRRRALVFYGAGHLWRAELTRETLVERIEAETAARVFSVIPEEHHLTGRTAPLIAPEIRTTRGTSLENQVDAVLELPGRDADTGSPLPRRLCESRDYLDMRRHRLALAPSYPPFAALERECARSR